MTSRALITPKSHTLKHSLLFYDPIGSNQSSHHRIFHTIFLAGFELNTLIHQSLLFELKSSSLFILPNFKRLIQGQFTFWGMSADSTLNQLTVKIY